MAVTNAAPAEISTPRPRLAPLFLAVLTIAAAWMMSLSPAAAQAEANGRNTNFVRFDGGSFERTHTGEWHEFGNGSNEVRYRWRETGRDDWSIYFRDDSRAMNMQIDMHRDWIRLEWQGHPMQDQYRIIEADPRINGRLVTYAQHQGGFFRMVAPNVWREYDANRQHTATFREVSRDAWSVYLRDDSRNMDMQIDVHRNWIRLAWPGHPMQDQYAITRSR